MSTMILTTVALGITAWLGFLSVAKASTIFRCSLAKAVIACLASLYLLNEPAPISALSPLLAMSAAALVLIGLTAHWLLHAVPDTTQDELRGS